ncbi:membrane protein [Idiomarina xiamenensis]|uniref:TM2 domain-containing protein n=1 Tax=Idiomarina xiamenensis 10-D-4 TaxID=740709 RepID=K2L1X0_9GAMM|nr:membrane protein [Idiomarina xiamenensis]EKE83850.1 hypothetical protein A10D4_06881 [Idiomarina xiamenensis 10-D-4]
MSTSERLNDEEEQLRQQIRQLSDEQRKCYFRHEQQRLKDPDTYAVLNYFFLAGLHHFYLGKFARGMVNLVLMLIGILLLKPLPWLGGGLIVAVLLIELPQLFNAQNIVHRHNNQQIRDLLQQVKMGQLKDKS